MRFGLTALLAVAMAGPALAEPDVRLVPREPFARAHVQLMTRVQRGTGPGIIADVDVWAEGTRLRAVIAGDVEHAEYWIDGLASAPLRIVKGRISPAKQKTLASGLELALRATPDSGNRQNDRVAGKPCKIVEEKLNGGYTLRRCLWRGLPLAVELTGHGFEFNAAATLIEESVTVADLQPPQGAPAAPTSLNAAR